MTIFKEKEGYIKTNDRSIYYHIFGEGSKTPLLTFHGGPGASHKLLLNLKELAAERPVIFYDQFCCGKSSLNPNINKTSSLWVMDNFVSEIPIIRKELGLDQVHLFGASFGTMLIVNYLKTKPTGIKSVIFSDPAISAHRWKEDCLRLMKELPEEARKVIISCEQKGTTDSKEYEEAMLKFYKLFVCRMDPWPKEMLKAFEGLNKDIYLTMWGPSEFHPTGNLKDYDGTDILKHINFPTLFICGRHDEATPETTSYYRSLTPNAEMAIFEKSAHLPYIEEKDLFLKTLADFLHIS